MDVFSAPIVGSSHEPNTVRMIVTVIELAYEGLTIYDLFKSNFYFYGLGRGFAKALAMTLNLVDELADLNIITPVKPWIRYDINNA